MIRVAAGTGRTGPLRLVVDGVAVNAGLPDEPLPQTLLAFAHGLQRLGAGRGAQVVELPRSELLWLLQPGDGALELRWVRRGPPRSAVVKRATVDLPGLGAAVAEAIERLPRTAKLRKALEHLQPPDPPELLDGFELERGAGALRVWLRVEALPAPHGAAWGSLLAPGRLELRHQGHSVAASREPPFLALEDLVRWASRALRPGGHPALPFPEGGELAVDGEGVRLGRHRWPGERHALAEAVAELAQGLLDDLHARAPVLARAAAARALAHDAKALLGRARQKPVPARRGGARPGTARERAPATPIARGSVRKVSFERLFEVRLPFPIARLELDAQRAYAFGDGQLAALDLASGKRLWTAGVRAVRAGHAILGVDARADRLVRLDPASGAVRWFRDSEGIEPLALHDVGAGVLVLQQPDGLSGRLAETGFPRWHLHDPAGEPLFALVSREGTFATSRSGHIAFVDPVSGELHYRAQAPRPFRQPPLRVGASLFALLEGDGSDELLHAEAATAEVIWGGRLDLRDAGPLAAVDDAVATVGRTGDGWALAIVRRDTGEGKLVGTGFQGRARPALATTQAGFLVCAADGRVVLYDSLGQVRFSDAEPSGPTARTLMPALERRLALVGSEEPALYDLAEGRRVARLPRLEGLSALAADEGLRVVAGDDAGTVRGYRLRGHLAVVPDVRPAR